MTRTRLGLSIVVTLIAAACGGGDEAGSGATAPRAGDGVDTTGAPASESVEVPESATLTAVEVQLPADVDGLAVGFGSVWAHVFPDEGDPELLQLDPATGAVLGSVVVPELGPSVVVGDDAVWVIGGFRLHRVDPASLAVESVEFTPPDAFLISWFHAAGALWGIPNDTGDVYRLDPGGTLELALSVDAEENSSSVVGSTLFIEDARSDALSADVDRSVVVVDLGSLTERARLDVAATGLGSSGDAAWGSTAPIDDDHPSLFRIDPETLEVTRLPVEAEAEVFLDRAVPGDGTAVYQIAQDLEGADFVLRIDGPTVERGDLPGFPLVAASDGTRLWAVTLADETRLVGVG